MRTDEQLAAEAQGGSAEAFDQLVMRYRDKLLRFLLTRCANHANAEDAIQDTFVSAWRYLHTYDSRWRFSTWIYRIALRNAMRQPEPAVESADEPSDDTQDPLRACIVDGDFNNLWLTAKRVLSPDAFTAMWLRYAEEMSTNEVSQALDRSASWTKVTLMRARRKLNREIGAEVAA